MTYCQQNGSQNSEFGTLDDDSLESQLQLEKEITQAQLRLNNLLEQRRARKERTNARVSPLLRLPTELLRRISMAAFPPGIDVNRWGEDTPFLLGSICTTWRSIAWAMPQLWSTVWVKVEERYHPSKLQILDDWLIRSQNFPISVCMNLVLPGNRDFDLQIERMWKIVDCVTRRAERWQNVQLHMPYFFDEQKCHVPSTFPQLRSLAIFARKCPRDYGNPDIFEQAPILTDISLGVELRHFTFPISSISRLSLGCVSLHEALELLGRHPNLTHCVFACIDGFRWSESYSEAEALNLQSLDIGSVKGMNPIDKLLEKLDAPCLQDLTIRMNWTRSSVACGDLLSDLRYPSTLLRLCLVRIYMSTSELVKCLDLLPNLRELKLVQMDLLAQNTILEKLTIHEDQRPPFLLPQLVDLFFVLSHQYKLDKFAQMAKSRRLEPTPERQVAQLQSLSIHILDPKGEEKDMLDDGPILEPFKDLKEGGMKMDFQWLSRLRYGSFILDSIVDYQK